MRSLVTSTGFLTLLIVISASAAKALPQRNGNPQDRGAPPIDPLFSKLDTNGDMVISAEELAKANQTLQSLDKNNDGILDRRELFPQDGGFPGIPNFFGGAGGRSGMGPDRFEQKLTEKFDLDENGYLDLDERNKALEAVQSRGRGRRPPRRGPGGLELEPGTPGPRVQPDEVKKYSGEPLYASNVLRTLFIEFDNDDWENQMAKLKKTDVEMPATLSVDGKEYPLVGVKFRGQSSFDHVSAGSKRSLNLSMDFIHPDQHLQGYKTLNLLNCNGDASFLSSILFSHLATPFLPVPKANAMTVVINGESWGIFCNVQQFNKDFLKEFYGSAKGARWKVAGSPQADGGLRYLGEDFAPYRQRFEIKSKDADHSWKSLVNLCKVLNQTPIDELPAAIEPILNVEGTLRFLAIDMVIVNSDGYWTRASDYSIYLDPSGVFHMIPHDMNEAFRGERGPGRGRPGGGGPPGGGLFGGLFGQPPGGRGHGGPTLDPLEGINNDRMPLRSKLLAVPRYRQRYLEYVRTLAEKSLTHQNLAKVIANYQQLIGTEVKLDTRRTSSYDQFTKATAPLNANLSPVPGSINEFIQVRRDFLLQHDEIKTVASIQIQPLVKKSPPKAFANPKINLIVNEFLANNTTTNRDPEGEFEDWIELFNQGTEDLDLTGIYLTDDPKNLMKWGFPSGTQITSGGYLIAWADADDGDGIHANFKLSKEGESIILSNGKTIIDQVDFGPQDLDISEGRLSSTSGKIQKLKPTPGKKNQPVD